MTNDLLNRFVEQLRMTGGDLADLCQPLADAIEAVTAERDEALNQLDSAIHSVEVLEKRVAKFMADNARLTAALTDAGPYLERGLDKMAFNIIRAALKGETP